MEASWEYNCLKIEVICQGITHCKIFSEITTLY